MGAKARKPRVKQVTPEERKLWAVKFFMHRQTNKYLYVAPDGKEYIPIDERSTPDVVISFKDQPGLSDLKLKLFATTSLGKRMAKAKAKPARPAIKRRKKRKRT